MIDLFLVIATFLLVAYFIWREFELVTVYKWVVPTGGIFIPMKEEKWICPFFDIKLVDDAGNVWALIDQSGLHVYEGYAWDGCSPKFSVLGFTVGTWDGPVDELTGKQQMYIPSLAHDVLCQFRRQIHPNQRWIDRIFYDLAVEENFRFAKLYYRAVRCFQIISGNG